VKELFQATGLTKVYPPHHTALDGVDFDIRPGEVHALIGENGAGKSTLSSLISGLRRPDGGGMTLDGAPYAPASRHEAEALGVRIVTQELNLVGTLTVAESLFVDRMPSRFGVIDRRRMEREAREALRVVGAEDIDPAAPIDTLGVGRRQLVEIAAGLSRECKVLILDEPTAALTQPEAEALFAQIEGLRARGVGMIYISHHLEEILHLADRITVLRDGRYVTTFQRGEATRDDLVRAMVGRDVAAEFVRSTEPAPEIALEVKNVRGVSFQVRKGEIFGIGGLMGSGRTELLRAIFGADRGEGEILVNNRPVRVRNPQDAIRMGIGLLTEDRKEQGLLLTQPIRVNASLTRIRDWARGGVIDAGKEREESERLRNTLGIRCRTVEQTAAELSGGNQQKVVMAKWLARECDVLMFDEPTRGVDVGAKFEIYHLLDEFAAQGKAVVVVSSELNELLAICDRLLVLSAGHVADVLDRNEFDNDRIMSAALQGYQA
jgi:ribose transport system ATP-binding protein